MNNFYNNKWLWKAFKWMWWKEEKPFLSPRHCRFSTNNTEKLFRVICFVWYTMHLSLIQLLFVSHLPLLHFTPSLSHPPLSPSPSMFHEWILAILRSGSVWSSRVQHDSIMYYLHKLSFRLATICSGPVTWLKIGLCKSVGLGGCAFACAHHVCNSPLRMIFLFITPPCLFLAVRYHWQISVNHVQIWCVAL